MKTAQDVAVYLSMVFGYDRYRLDQLSRRLEAAKPQSKEQ